MRSTPCPRAFARLALVLALGLPAVPRAQTAAGAPEGRLWAVVVGVNDATAAAPRPTAEQDAEAVHRLLTGPLRADPARVRLLTGSGAGSSRVRGALAALSAVAPEDQVVLYVAAPSTTRDMEDGEQRATLVTGDGQGLSLEILARFLGNVPARRVLVVLDAALGGTGTAPLGPASAAGRGRHLLVAAGPDEPLVEADGTSALVRLLLDALGDGTADPDGDARVRATELGAYVIDHLPASTGGRQHPYFRTFGDDGEGVTFDVPVGALTDAEAVTPLPDPRRAPLRVATDPAGAHVTLDGRPLGTTPLEAEVAVGEGRLVAEREGFQPYTWSVHVRDGHTTEVTGVLLTAAAALTWRGLPPDAAVTIDGLPRPAGETAVALPPGPHEVTVRHGRRAPLTRTVFVGPDGTVVEYRRNGFRSLFLASSIPVPGLGQALSGSPLEGAAVAAAVVGAAAFTYAAYGGYDEATADYERQREAYLAATNEADATRLRAEMEAGHRATERARGRISAGYVALAAVYALNLLDAVVHHARTPVLVVHRAPTGVAVAPAALPTGAPGVALTLRF